MAAAVSVDQCTDGTIERADQLQRLRRQMAAISGKVGTDRSSTGLTREVLSDEDSLLPVSDALAGSIGRALRRGTVVVAGGARSLPLDVVAAVTAAGGHAAIVGMPQVSVLAAVQKGADLSRLALVRHPGCNAMEAASVLMDGMDLVVLGLGGRRVSLTSARALTARARSNGCTLLVTDGDWEGAAARLQAQVVGYDGVSSCGLGCIRGVRTSVRAVYGRGVCGNRGIVRSA